MLLATAAAPSSAHAQPGPAARKTAARVAAAPLAVITFRARAEVRGCSIKLADVALVESANARVAALLRAIEVGTAPLCGDRWNVSADYARVRIRQVGLDPDRMLIRGASLTSVLRPAQVLPAAVLEKAATEALAAAHPGAAVQLTSALREMHLPVGEVSVRPEPGQMFGSDSGTLVLEILVDQQKAGAVSAGFRLVRMAPVVVAQRDLAPGTVLSADDLKIEQRPEAPGPLRLSDLSFATGQEVSAPIRAGTALTASMLRPAVLIHRGALVRLICKGPMFVATVTGEALQDGTAGQAVRCRNLASQKEVTGVVVDEETAEVPF